MFIDWEVDADKPNRQRFTIRVDLDAMGREMPDVPVDFSYHDYSRPTGLGYDYVRNSEIPIMKHFAGMYPTYAEWLGDYFEEIEE